MNTYFNNDDNILENDIALQLEVNKIRDTDYNILLLANEYELLSFHYRKILFRKIIATYNKVRPSGIDLYLEKLFPIVTGFKMDYLMNRQVYLIDMLKKIKKISTINNNSKIGIVKIIGPGEIIGQNLYAYEDTEYVFNELCNIKKTFTYYYYYDWGVSDSYLKLIHKYPCKLIDEFKYPTNIKHEYDIVFVNEFSLKKKINRDNEITSLPFRKFFISLGLRILKKGGDLYMEYFNISNIMTFKLIQSVRNLFTSVKFIRSKLSNNTLIGGYYIFKNFSGINTINNTAKKHKHVSMNTKLVKYIDKTQQGIYKKHHFFIEKCESVKIVKKPYKYYIDYQIATGIDWCKANNVKIHNYYLETNKIQLDYILRLFPIKEGVDYNKIQLYYDSYFSITLPEDAEQISEVILEYYPKTTIITDGCANVGGSTIGFAKYFDTVYSIEIDTNRYNCLVNNISVYNYKNIRSFNMSFLDFSKKTDVIFLDPPWGGIFYKLSKSVELYLNNNNIKDLMKKNYIVKVPFNYNTNDLKKYKHLKKYKIIKLKTFMLLLFF
jgi:16S rRNA G966 N2-methylase RsmD